MLLCQRRDLPQLVAVRCATWPVWAASAGFDPVFGARPLKRAIQERIENPLSRLILDGTLGAKDRVKVEATKGQISFVKA